MAFPLSPERAEEGNQKEKYPGEKRGVENGVTQESHGAGGVPWVLSGGAACRNFGGHFQMKHPVNHLFRGGVQPSRRPGTDPGICLKNYINKAGICNKNIAFYPGRAGRPPGIRSSLEFKV